MRVFVSYAGEQRPVADRLALGLRQAGHRVFFDRDALGAGDDYDDAIRREVEKSSLFVYLVSPQSLKHGAYTLTELGFARKRWPNPSERVLPVMVEVVPIESIDAYLRAVSVLMPRGDIVAEVLGRVHAIASRRRRRIGMTTAAVMLVALSVGYGTIAWSSRLVGADHTVSGKVIDGATGGDVPGASVEVQEKDGTVLQHALTDREGRFGLTFRIGRTSPGADLVIQHQGYVLSSVPMTLTADSVAPREHNVNLLANGLRECLQKDGSSNVVIGHFQPPIDGTAVSGGDLATRIMEALSDDLTPRFQSLTVSKEGRPRFVACPEAKPRSTDLGGRYAEVLGADAFLSGNVVPASGGYDVHARIADRFALFVLKAVTRNVQFGDPAAARFDSETHVAILTATALGNEKRGRYADCVEITSYAKEMLGRDTDILDKTRSRCQRALGLHRLEGS